MLGQQYLAPNKRVIPVIAAVVLFGLAWRTDMATAIGLLLVALPFPRYTTFGNTNLAFVLLLLVIWLLRVTSGSQPAGPHAHRRAARRAVRLLRPVLLQRRAGQSGPEPPGRSW